MQIKIEKDFNLDHIFDCGQCFRWEKEGDGSYTGVAFGRAVNMAYDGEVLTIDEAPRLARASSGADGGAPRSAAASDALDEAGDVLRGAPRSAAAGDALWRDYLDLATDYGQIKAELSSDDKMKAAIDYGYGIRILNQDPWETFVSFIISQNNNIPRIKGCIEKLCEMFGESLGEFRGKVRYSFPAIETLAGLTAQDLAPVKLGYRAPYIIESAKKVKAEGLPTEENLLEFKGVGPKVANCIKLFALRDTASFPIDTWMVKIMNHLYGFDEGDKKGMQDFAASHFGQYGGYAQQYLFYYARSLEELKK